MKNLKIKLLIVAPPADYTTEVYCHGWDSSSNGYYYFFNQNEDKHRTVICCYPISRTIIQSIEVLEELKKSIEDVESGSDNLEKNKIQQDITKI
jgi:hypothetical protein